MCAYKNRRADTKGKAAWRSEVIWSLYGCLVYTTKLLNSWGLIGFWPPGKAVSGTELVQENSSQLTHMPRLLDLRKAPQKSKTTQGSWPFLEAASAYVP